MGFCVTDSVQSENRYKSFFRTHQSENRLISMETATNRTESSDVPRIKLDFVYDYKGRRVSKIVSQYTNSTWEAISTNSFVYDGWNMIADVSVSESQSLCTNYYVWGLDLSGSLQGAGGVGGLLTRTRSSDTQTVHYCHDANGNVGQVVHVDKDTFETTILAKYEYDPFGNVVAKSGPEADSNPFRFSTKYQDNETELSYYGYRYYGADMGRWLSRDPIGEDGGENLYGFVGNRPIIQFDTLGLFATCSCNKSSCSMVAGSEKWRIGSSWKLVGWAGFNIPTAYDGTHNKFNCYWERGFSAQFSCSDGTPWVTGGLKTATTIGVMRKGGFVVFTKGIVSGEQEVEIEASCADNPPNIGAPAATSKLPLPDVPDCATVGGNAPWPG